MRLLHFGHFELDLESRALRKDGAFIPLTAKVLETLIVLVQNYGRPVGKEELLSLLWPDTTVEEANLTQNVSTLRKALGDDPKNASYIRTIPGRGYEFVCAVTETMLPAVIDQAMPKPPKRLLLRALAGGLLVLVLATFKWAWLRPRAGMSVTSVSQAVPLVSLAGFANCPAFSPDGKQIAFIWSQEVQIGSSIYVKLIDSGQTVRLTYPPGADGCPAWSRDGQWIAFHRNILGDSGIYIVSALGGVTRKITPLALCLGLDWYPDGKHLAVSGASLGQSPRILSVAIDSGNSRSLPLPRTRMTWISRRLSRPMGARLPLYDMKRRWKAMFTSSETEGGNHGGYQAAVWR